MFGGIVNTKDNTDELWAYRFATNTWRGPLSPTSGQVPLPRHGHTAVVYEVCSSWHWGRALL